MTSNFLVLFFVLLGVGCTPQCEKNHFEPAKPIGQPIPDYKITDLTKGKGPKIRPGDKVIIHFRGWLYDSRAQDGKGQLINDSYKMNRPQSLVWGETELIEGWQEGLAGVQMGTKRRLFIPSTMAFGNNGAGTQVPIGAHLIYEIEVLSLEPGSVKEDPPELDEPGDE